MFLMSAGVIAFYRNTKKSLIHYGLQIQITVEDLYNANLKTQVFALYGILRYIDHFTNYRTYQVHRTKYKRNYLILFI